MDEIRDANRTAGNGRGLAGRLRPIAMIVIFDIAAPLATYGLLRSADVSTVTALLLSGVFPAFRVTTEIIRHRRLEVVGALVLAGIIVGTALGLITHSTRMVLLEGSVPTAIFAVACLGSLWTERPLMYSFALEFIGPDSARGREMAALWRHEEFRRIWRTITAVWGVGFVLEVALRVVIVYSASTGTALAISKVTPFVWAGVFSAWTAAYTTYLKKKGERTVTVTAETPQTSNAD